jgi:hypothetical protein
MGVAIVHFIRYGGKIVLFDMGVKL